MARCDRRVSRRAFLVGAGSVLTLGGTAQSARATEPPAGSPVEYVDHITATRDDREELLDYAPKLYYPLHERREGRSKTRGQYGWIAESDAYDVTAYYYWTRHVTQRSSLAYLGVDFDGITVPGVGWRFGGDSHHLDHEPTIVFVAEDGTVDSVVTTGGHHYAIEIDGTTGHLTEDRVPDRRTHVHLGVVRPWNHYVEVPTDLEGTRVDQYADFGSWLELRDSWYRNGRFEDTAPAAIEDPFSFYDDGEYRNHWWRDGTVDAWIARHVWNRLVERDQLRFEQ